MRHHAWLGVGAVAIALFGQEPLEFGATVAVVQLDVFVSRDGAPVTGLSAENFEVHDNGTRRRVEIVQRTEAPSLHVVLVLDTSTSVAGEPLDDLKAAAADFLAGLGDGDVVTLTSFSHRTRLESDPGIKPDAIHLLTLEARGGTALHDAVYAGLQLADTRGGRRPMVVVFSDGEDGLSWLSAGQVERAARESDATVFAIHSSRRPIPSDGTPAGWARRFDPSTRFLRKVAEDSGGKLWGADEGGLHEAFQRVLAELQSHYLLRFSPEQGECASWHELKVKLKGVKGKVRARRGYSVTCDDVDKNAFGGRGQTAGGSLLEGIRQGQPKRPGRRAGEA